MSSSSTNLNFTTIFNKHFEEFLEDILQVFPNNVDILTAKNSLLTIRKANPKLLIKIWYKYVAFPYNAEIESGNIDFFINKDYSKDVEKAGQTDKIMEAIDRLRPPIQQMTKENQEKTMKYIQNLSKISVMCEK